MMKREDRMADRMFERFGKMPKGNGSYSVFVGGGDRKIEWKNGKKISSGKSFAKQKRIVKKKGQKAKCLVRTKSSQTKNGKVMSSKGGKKWVDCKKAKKNKKAKDASVEKKKADAKPAKKTPAKDAKKAKKDDKKAPAKKDDKKAPAKKDDKKDDKKAPAKKDD